MRLGCLGLATLELSRMWIPRTQLGLVPALLALALALLALASLAQSATGKSAGTDRDRGKVKDFREIIF